MLGAILSAQSIIMVGYMAVGVAGYLAYPTNVSSNILNSFPQDDVAMQVWCGVMLVVVCVRLLHLHCVVWVCGKAMEKERQQSSL
jgi:amino acid permease